MRRSLCGGLVVAMVLLHSACATTAPSHMMFKLDPTVNVSSVKPESGKAALVVARTTGYGGRVEFSTYLEKEMIGVTSGNTYFIKRDIPPGTHYVISQAESVEPVKINFEPDRVYYIQQIPRPGVWRARLSVAVTAPEQLMQVFGGCKLVVYSPTNPGDNLSEKDYQQAVTDYEREVKEGRHKDYEGYRGVAAK